MYFILPKFTKKKKENSVIATHTFILQFSIFKNVAIKRPLNTKIKEKKKILPMLRLTLTQCTHLQYITSN